MTNNNKFSFSYTHSSHPKDPMLHNEIKYKTIINEMKINCLFVYLPMEKLLCVTEIAQEAENQTKGKESESKVNSNCSHLTILETLENKKKKRKE